MDLVFSPMRTYTLFLTSFFIAACAIPVTADTPLDNCSINVIVTEIMQIQGVDNLGDINPENLPPQLLETLGRELMGQMVDDEAWHQRLNLLMGGEGSSKLSELHSGMARTFLDRGGELACWKHSVMKPGMLSVFTGKSYLISLVIIVLFLSALFTVIYIKRRRR